MSYIKRAYYRKKTYSKHKSKASTEAYCYSLNLSNNRKRTYRKRTYSRKTYSKNKPSKASTEAYCYSLNLSNGKKYVGYTSNPDKRLKDHFSGNGAKVTQKYKPISINHIQKYKSIENAKKAETRVYQNMKKYHGIKNVRGAGYTNSINF